MPTLNFETGIKAVRIGDSVCRATRSFAKAGIDTPSRDARLLVAKATGLDSARLISEPDRPMTQTECHRLIEFVERRCAREPVSRVLGYREFYGRGFIVTPVVLDPRPDSETLIEAALALVEEECWRARPIRILDVGTGSGCLLVTLLAELPLASGIGTDLSSEALSVAAQNAAKHGVASRARFEMRRSLEDVEEPCDLLVCNPPYIPSREIALLAPEVRDHEPRAALDGGVDGLNIYREVIPDLFRVCSRSWALFEVGAGQAGSVTELLGTARGAQGAAEIRFASDLGGHVRCVAAKIQV